MATTSNTYTGNGSNKLFSITFPYIDESDIDVYLNGTIQAITTQYTFANATTIEFVTAPPNGATVLIDRSTDDITLAATFFAGSSIRASDLNENFDQVLYIAQETNNNVANAVAGQIPDGTITSPKIADGTILDVNINAAAGIGASKLAFTQVGSGATERTIDSKLNEVVSVKDFGAVGDGVTNDTAAIQATIDAVSASGGGIVYVPPGNYSVLTLNLKSGVKFVGSGVSSVFLKQPGAGASDSNNLINAYGTISGTSSALTVDAAAATSSVTVSNGGLFAAGDWCLLRDNTWANTGVAGRNQEIVRVALVSGNTVTFAAKSLGSYAVADTAELVKITPVEGASVEAISIVIPTGATTGGGISTDVCVNFTVRDCHIIGPNDNPAIYLSRTANSLIQSNVVRNGQNLSSGGYAYAYCIGESSHNVRVIGNHQENVRESNATNRARYVIFSGNSSQGSLDSHFNTHGSWCENVVIANNTSSGDTQGYSVGYATHTRGDQNVSIIGNVITNALSNGIASTAPSDKPNQDVSITGNTIINYACSGVSAKQGIVLSYTTNFLVNGNYIDGNNQNLASYGVYAVNSANNGLISGNSVVNMPNGYGYGLVNVSNVAVIGNFANNVSSFNVRTINPTTGCRVFANVADDTLNSIGTDTRAHGNSFQLFTGSATYDPPSLVDGDGVTTTVTCTGATLGGFARASFSLSLAGITLTAWVSAANTVSVRFQNESGGPIDLASGTLRVYVENPLF